jgi:hypothetical protein
MKVLKTSTQMLHQIMDLYTPKNEQQQRVQAITAMIITLLAMAVLFYSYFN